MEWRGPLTRDHIFKRLRVRSGGIVGHVSREKIARIALALTVANPTSSEGLAAFKRLEPKQSDLGLGMTVQLKIVFQPLRGGGRQFGMMDEEGTGALRFKRDSHSDNRTAVAKLLNGT